MSPAVEDTRDARERELRLLTEVAAGAVHVSWTYRTLGQPLADPDHPERTALFTHFTESLPEVDQKPVWELFGAGLVTLASGADGNPDRPGLVDVVLTDKGRAVLGARPDLGELPAPPPLLCDGVIHTQGEQPPAVVVCAETTGGMKRMVLCRDCGQRYALDAACLALAGFELDPPAPPVAIHLIPLPPGGQP